MTAVCQPHTVIYFESTRICQLMVGATGRRDQSRPVWFLFFAAEAIAAGAGNIARQ